MIDCTYYVVFVGVFLFCASHSKCGGVCVCGGGGVKHFCVFAVVGNAWNDNVGNKCHAIRIIVYKLKIGSVVCLAKLHK